MKMKKQGTLPNKIKLSKEQKHYVQILEQVDADLEKRCTEVNKLSAKLQKIQLELKEATTAADNLRKMRESTENYLKNIPPPPAFLETFKTVYEHHYHYHYPERQTTIWPSWPYYTPWWSYTTSGGQFNSNAVLGLVQSDYQSGGLTSGGNMGITTNGNTLSFNCDGQSFSGVKLADGVTGSMVLTNGVGKSDLTFCSATMDPVLSTESTVLLSSTSGGSQV